MVLVRAEVSLRGVKEAYSSTALVDAGARMSLVDEALADKLGVQYTGRELAFISIPAQVRGVRGHNS